MPGLAMPTLAAPPAAPAKAEMVAPGRTTNPAQARATARQFEAMFVGQMLGHMTQEVGTGGFFGGGQAEETYRSLLNQEYGNSIARSGGLGIADAVMKHILIAQETKK